MALKIVSVLASVLLVGALAHPHAKDLTEDIFAAHRAVTYFELEVNELSSSVYSLGSEFNLDVTGIANDVLDLLQQIGVFNWPQIRDMMSRTHNQVNADIEALESNLRQTRAQLVTISRDLEGDLPSLPDDVTTLKSTVGAGDDIFAVLISGLQNSVRDIEAAITDGIGTEEGQDVTRVWVGWSRIKDILTNRQFLVENVKLVYDVRALDAFSALDVVVGQIG